MSFNLQAAIDAAFATADNTITELNNTISDLQAQIADLQQQVADLQAQLAEQETPPDPDPEPDPEPTPDPDPIVWPNASNTGAKGTLTAYTGPMTISTAGTIIENKTINGTILVRANNVVIRNCKITHGVWYGIDADGYFVTVQDCTIIGPGTSAAANAGITGSGIFERNDISGSENGITLDIGASTVRNNYIHDLESKAGYQGHYDGIAVQGGQNGVLIEGNTVMGRDTSDVFVKDDFGSVSNVTINANYFGGNSGWVVVVDNRGGGGNISNVKITNNHIEHGLYGYTTVEDLSNVTEYSGNVDAFTGEPITL